jgi:hypothetical protein
MRAKEFFYESVLTELNMSPTYLQRFAAKIPGALAGIEFEMIVPGKYGNDSEFEAEPNYDMDRDASGIQDIIEFFSNGDDGFENSERDLNRLQDKLHEQYNDWLSEKIDRDWRHSDDGYEMFTDHFKNNWYNEETDGDLDIAAQEAWESRGRAYDDAREAFEQSYYESFSDEDWCEDQGISMHEIYSRHDLQWPYITFNGGDGDLDEIADNFRKGINRAVETNDKYHGSTKSTTAYTIEPDSSLEPDDEDSHSGLEFVSPPLPLPEIVKDLANVMKWAKNNDCYTNESCGLHMNVSVPNYHKDTLDYVKFALFIGDEFILQQFGRTANSFCKAAINKIKDNAIRRPDLAAEAMLTLKGHLDGIAGQIIHENATDKYTSLNLHDTYVEVRSPGGNWLNEPIDKLVTLLYRITVALDAACDPTKYKDEYAKKFYKLIATQGNNDITQLFAQYASGQINKDALKVAWADRVMNNPQSNKAAKVMPLANKIMRGNTGQSWWSVGFFNPSRGEITRTEKFVAKTEAEAISYARTKWQIPSGSFPDQYFEVKRLAPYNEPAQEPLKRWKVTFTDGQPMLVNAKSYREAQDAALLATARLSTDVQSVVLYEPTTA